MTAREKQNEYAKRWRKRNPEKVRAIKRRWRAANVEQERERERRRIRDPEQKAAYLRKWKRANRERVNATERRWREANPEAYKELCRDKAHRRRARIRGVESDRPKLMRGWAAALRDDPCDYCGQRGDIVMDHVRPMSAGGAHTVENTTAACRACNLKKGAHVNWKDWRNDG